MPTNTKRNSKKTVFICKVEANSEQLDKIPEFFATRDTKNPIILIIKPTQPTLSTFGETKISDYLNVDKIPSNFGITRNMYIPLKAGILFRDEDVISIRIQYLDKELENTIWSIYFNVLRDLLATYGVTIKLSSHRPNANDLVFIKDGVEKKFCALVDYDQELNTFLTLSFNADKIEGLYKLNTPKFKARGNVSHITDVVGGLREINPEIGLGFIDEFVDALVEKLGWESKEQIIEL